MTSASKVPSPTAVAVRQAPFTATESPSPSSDASSAAIRRRAPSPEASTVSMRPRSLTRPVNISRSPFPEPCADQHVLAGLLEARSERAYTVGDADRALALEYGTRLRGAHQDRRDEEAHLVHLAGVEERARERRAALHEQVLDLSAAKLGQSRLQPVAV